MVKRESVKSVKGEGVSRMKRLFQVILAAAMMVSFLPLAEAGDSAQLGLKVAFDLGYPQEIDVLAKAVANHVFDMNGDGITDGQDYKAVVDAYVLAEKYQAVLPAEILVILDVNGDGRIGTADSDLVTQEVKVYWIANDLGELRGHVDKIYQDAVNSADPYRIRAAIDSLRQIHGGEVKPRIAELDEIMAARPDLRQIIEDVRAKAVSLLMTIEEYIDKLMAILNPLKIWSEPEGPFEVAEFNVLTFMVRAADPDSASVDLKAVVLPPGAMFRQPIPGEDPTYSPNSAVGWMDWKPELGQSRDQPYSAVFEATNAEGEMVKLEVLIAVKPAVISIELTPTTWALDGIKLGEKRTNMLADGTVMHEVRNTGNVPVMVAIGYGPQIDILPSIVPGIVQGENTFITGIKENYMVLPPNERCKITDNLPAGDKAKVHLMYGAPTKVTVDARGHQVTYDLVAWPAIQ